MLLLSLEMLYMVTFPKLVYDTKVAQIRVVQFFEVLVLHITENLKHQFGTHFFKSLKAFKCFNSVVKEFFY